MLAGVVRRVNRHSGAVALEVEPDEYVIVEVIDHTAYVELGDVLAGDLGQDGYSRLRNMMRDFELRARVNAIGTTSAERVHCCAELLGVSGASAARS